ncbi:MAG: hypothetical protein ACM3SV_14285, partial [Betaproteobacteria bacterium]
RDNGKGMATAGERKGGFGLIGIRERAIALGGRVSISTAPGEGFSLEARIPLAPTEHAMTIAQDANEAP